MQLYFGIAADGRTYPDAPQPSGAVDAAIVGPAGLVGALEAQLGLTAPSSPRAVRIAAFLAKLGATGDATRFWTESFSKDPWSTAATLLMWRDALVAGGWTRKPIGAARVDDLASAEATGAPLPPGLVDRAVGLLAALPVRPGLRLSAIHLLEPISSLPPVWRRLVEALGVAGVEIGRASCRERVFRAV